MSRSSPLFTRGGLTCVYAPRSIDAILYDDELRVHDHIALARTCRALRAAYYTPPPNNDSYASFTSPIWAALIAQRPFEGKGRGSDLYTLSAHSPSDKKENRLRHLWSNRFDERQMAVLAVKRVAAQRKWSRAHQTYIETPQRHEKMPIRSVEWEEAIETVKTQVGFASAVPVRHLRPSCSAD